jgi:hypothetical protein
MYVVDRESCPNLLLPAVTIFPIGAFVPEGALPGPMAKKCGQGPKTAVTIEKIFLQMIRNPQHSCYLEQAGTTDLQCR